MGDDPPPSFLERLKRHAIFRIAAIYAVAGWMLIQISNSVLPNLGFPKDSGRFVIIVVALGFPVMLVLTWTFVKPRGIHPVALTHWTHLRRGLGSVLSITIITLACISGWRLWEAAETAHELQLATLVPIHPVHAFNPPPHSIAVLPFTNQSNDPSQQYFSDGITEEITDALGALPDVRVISWQSTSMYHGKDIAVTDVGQNLNVANILEGSIRRDGDRVRISAELINTVTGFQLWSSQYDRTFKDVFSIQDEITKAMVSALQLQLASNGPWVTPATTDTDAHDFYLKGLAAANARTATSLEVAIKNFQQAIRLDHHYAEAYAALAWTYAISHEYTNIPLVESLPKATRAAQQAVRLDPNLAAAHVALGAAYMLEQKPHRAETELRHALSLNPNDLEAHIVYASSFPASRYKEALVYFQQAAALDPNSAIAHYNLGGIYESLGDYKNAITEFQATIGLAPQLAFVRLDLAGLYHRNADDHSAVTILTGTKIDDPIQAQMLQAARLVYMAQQTPAFQGQALAALRQIDPTKMSTSDNEELVTLYAVLGRKSYAIGLLTRACANAPETCGDLAVNPSYQLLQSAPEFKKLVARYNIKQ